MIHNSKRKKKMQNKKMIKQNKNEGKESKMGKKIFCVECGATDDYEIRKLIRKYEGEGYCFTLEFEVPFCKECGEPIISTELECEIAQKANAIIRKQRGIISTEEINDILNDYGTSQKFLSKLLGWGEITLTRYICKNFTPNKENSDTLKSLTNPYVFQALLNAKLEEDSAIKEEKSFQKAQKRIEEKCRQLQQDSNIYLVINWFLSHVEDDIPLTHLALQKLLYYVQCWSIVLNGKWSFQDECQAWVHGAVYPQIYEYFKVFGKRPLPNIKMDISLDENSLKVLNLVKQYYYDIYNAKTLENICHLEKPYQEARQGLEEGTSCRSIINKNTIRKYYVEIAEKYGICCEKTVGIQNYLNALLENRISG